MWSHLLLSLVVTFVTFAGAKLSGTTGWKFSPPGQQISGRAGKGGIFGSATVDPGPACCQICTKKFYHSLALLDLSENMEKTALARFHKYRDHHNEARSLQKSSSLLETSNHAKGFLGSATSAMSSMSGSMNAMGAGASNGNAGSTENSYGGVDVLDRISYIVDDAQQAGPHEMKSTRPTFPTPDRMEGAMGGGACCNVCPLWFIPYNQRMGMQPGIAPEYGKATFLEEKEEKFTRRNTRRKRDKGFVSGAMSSVASASNSLSGGAGPRVGAKSRGGVGPGPSQCCNVCTDDAFPMRDINVVNDMTFVEVKESVIRAQRQSRAHGEQSAQQQQQQQEKGFIPGVGASTFKPPPGAPATNAEQCCYLCSEQANCGWEGTDPFSEPTSWGQHLEDQSRDPDFMNEIAKKRTWDHRATVSNHFIIAGQAIEALKNMRL